MIIQNFGTPGVGSDIYTTPREVIAGNQQFAQHIPGGRVVDGTNARDPNNPELVSVYAVLRAGSLLGKITSSGLYGSSIIGLSNAAIGGDQTTLVTDTPLTAAEIVRRIGSSGSLTLTGAPYTGGTVRSRTIAYSAVNTTTGAITISADALAAVSAVNQVDSLPFVDSTGSGSFIITVEGVSTGNITYSSTAATLVSNINTALNAVFGASAIVATGASLSAIILTFSGTGFTDRPVGTVTATLNTGATGFTVNGGGTVGTAYTSAVTTAGVAAASADAGEFEAGSLIGPTDGSQVPLTILADAYGLLVNGPLAINGQNTQAPYLTLTGHIATGNIVSYPTDPSLKAWIKNALNAVGKYTFDDAF